MSFRRRGAERGYRVIDPMLSQGDDIHIALHHNRMTVFRNRRPSAVQVIKFRSFLEYRGFGGVEVLWLAVAEYPSAKSDNLTPIVMNREDNARPESIIEAV